MFYKVLSPPLTITFYKAKKKGTLCKNFIDHNANGSNTESIKNLNRLVVK